MLKIGLTGGIGSGKSTASRVFASLGVPVYDSDSRAKELMTSDPRLMAGVRKLIGDDAYVEGGLNKPLIAKRIFNDKGLLSQMNALVHPAVIKDFRRWAAEQEAGGAPYVMMENAILFEAGFDSEVDLVVTVSAPIEQRMERAASRDGIDISKIKERIAHQTDDRERESRADYIIGNEDGELMLPQILHLHDVFTQQA